MNETLNNFTLNINLSLAGRRTLPLVILESTLFLVLDVSALLGNSLLCIAVWKYQSFRTITNVFIFSLALTDLLTAVLVLPFGMVSSFADRWMFGGIGCQIYRFTGYCLVGVSLSILAMLAFERYSRVSNADFHLKVFSMKGATIMNLVIWCMTCGLVAVVFPLMGVKFQLASNNPTICLTVFNNRTASLLFNSVHTVYFLLPCTVMLWCYTRLYKIICKHNATVLPTLHLVIPIQSATKHERASTFQDTSPGTSRTQQNSNQVFTPALHMNCLVKRKAFYLPGLMSRQVLSSSGENDARQAIEEKKLFRMLAVVLIGFIICWLPGFVFGITEIAKPIANDTLQYLNLFYYFPAYTSSMINPIIFGTMSKRFRDAFKNILFCRR